MTVGIAVEAQACDSHLNSFASSSMSANIDIADRADIVIAVADAAVDAAAVDAAVAVTVVVDAVGLRASRFDSLVLNSNSYVAAIAAYVYYCLCWPSMRNRGKLVSAKANSVVTTAVQMQSVFAALNRHCVVCDFQRLLGDGSVKHLQWWPHATRAACDSPPSVIDNDHESLSVRSDPTLKA